MTATIKVQDENHHGEASSKVESTSKTLTTPSIVDCGTSAEESRNIYNAWASNYERDIRDWGYEMPERVARLLKDYLPPPNDDSPDSIEMQGRGMQKVNILDAGAGDGLSGVALYNVGYHGIDAIDLSPHMLEVAKQRGCYNSTQVVDLSQNTPPYLPFDKDCFDAVTCVGTLTYINPKSAVLEEFVRVTKPGGYVCYTNRTDKLGAWSETEDRLVREHKWEKIYVSEALPYLPNNPEFGKQVEVVIHLFRVT